MTKSKPLPINSYTEHFSFPKTIQALQSRKINFELSSDDRFTFISLRFEEMESDSETRQINMEWSK